MLHHPNLLLQSPSTCFSLLLAFLGLLECSSHAAANTKQMNISNQEKILCDYNMLVFIMLLMDLTLPKWCSTHLLE